MVGFQVLASEPEYTSPYIQFSIKESAYTARMNLEVATST